MTTLSPARVAGVDPASLAAVGKDCDALSAVLADRGATLTQARAGSRGGWHGVAADHAGVVLQLERERLTAAAEQFRALASLLVQAAEELTAARAEVRAVLAEAHASGLTLHGTTFRSPADGPAPAGGAPRAASAPAAPSAAGVRGAARREPPPAVSGARGPAPHSSTAPAAAGPGSAIGTGPVAAGPAAAGGPAPAEAAARLTARLVAALAAAERTDGRYAAALSRSAGQARGGGALDPVVSRAALLAAAALVGGDLPAPGSSPGQVHAWWLRLGPDEQRMLVRDQPQLVGSLDGIPAATRDRANRALLDQLLADEVDSVPNPGLLAISDRLARHRGSSPPALLLSLGLAGQGRAVLSFGDPDTADQVSVYVPGMGTSLADVGGKDADRALAVHDAAVAAAPTARPGATASMVWLGYDAPQGLLAVADDARARAGAPSYDGFLRGLRATHAGPPARVTALGHSYGSLLVGLAGRRPGGTGADDMVLIGSPGTGAAHASELGVAPGHVWVGAAPQDPVSSALPGPRQGALIAVGTLLAGVVPPLTRPVEKLEEDRRTAWFGTNPATPSFGARLLPVDGGRGPGGGFAGAHSTYLDRGSGTLAAIGRIVAGRH